MLFCYFIILVLLWGGWEVMDAGKLGRLCDLGQLGGWGRGEISRHLVT